MIEWIAGVGVALAAVVLAWLAGLRSGANYESTANQAQKADALEQELTEIANAARARNAVDPGVVPDNDKYRRD